MHIINFSCQNVSVKKRYYENICSFGTPQKKEVFAQVKFFEQVHTKTKSCLEKSKVGQYKKNLVDFLILKHFTRSFHQAYNLYFLKSWSSPPYFTNQPFTNFFKDLKEETDEVGIEALESELKPISASSGQESGSEDFRSEATDFEGGGTEEDETSF